MKRLIVSIALGAASMLAACGGGGDRDACVSSYVGTFDGEMARGVMIAQLDWEGGLNVIVDLDDNDMNFNGNASVDEEGVIAPSGALMLEGTFDYDNCSASGTWDYGFYGTGTWSLDTREPGLL